MHSTASDGALSPAALMARAAAAGLSVLSLTDHDTVAGLGEARRAAAAHGLRLVDGIEITAVENGRDFHILGYFIDPDHEPLASFLAQQRGDRVRRVREMAGRLRALGCAIDEETVIASAAAMPGKSIGRPQLAAALVAGGHARDVNDAFARFLGSDAAAFVSRQGSSPEHVIDIIGGAGGVASLAHPGVTRQDDVIPRLASAGLTALEARHSDHNADQERHYRELAARHGLAVSGGSDYHGEAGRRISTLGVVALAAQDFAALESRVPARSGHR